MAPHADLEKLSRRFAEFSIKKTIMFDDEVDDEECKLLSPLFAKFAVATVVCSENTCETGKV